jgi:aspartokinase
METIAVYWEPKIRIYGLATQIGLTLYYVRFPRNRMTFWAQKVQELEEKYREFLLINLQELPDDTMQLCLVPSPDEQQVDKGDLLKIDCSNGENTTFEVVKPVEMIYMHGPHFQDRYGIFDAVLRPLQKTGIPILASGCAGTSVYVIVPGNRAHEAEQSLSETFVL